MKVAIYLSGRIYSKDGNRNIEHLKNLKQKYDVTYFCSLNTDTIDDFTRNFCQELDISSDRLHIQKTPDNAEVEDHGRHAWNRKTVYSMFYHNKKCMDMTNASNIHFDVVVKYRGDIHNNNNSEFLIEMPHENTVYIPEGADWGGINDQIAYGNKETMTKYSECVTKMIDYCKSGTNYHPETLLQRHIRDMHLVIKRFNYSYFLNR
jgi:hypothetical protein